MGPRTRERDPGLRVFNTVERIQVQKGGSEKVSLLVERGARNLALEAAWGGETLGGEIVGRGEDEQGCGRRAQGPF